MDDDGYDVPMITATIPIVTSRHSLGSISDSLVMANSISTGCTLINNASINVMSSSSSTSNKKIITNAAINLHNASNSGNRYLTGVCSPHDISSSSSDVDIDDSTVKEEPMSPDSSCPSSPNTPSPPHYGINVNLANVATFTNADLVFEHNKVSDDR